MKVDFPSYPAKPWTSMGIVLVLVLIPQLLLSQCANFGAFDIGEDVEITCADSCLALVSPSIATVASGGAEYEVEEIEYALPYPFNQGSVAINTGDDVYSPVIPLGFTFEFFGNNYTECRISSNGWFSFDTGETAGYNPNGTNPNQNMPNNSVMGIYSDLNPSTCGNVRYDTYGTAPCREFVVSWNAVCQFSCSSQQVSAEVVLYEGTNVIEIYLGNRPQCGWGSAVVGIMNQPATIGISPESYNTGNWSATNEAWRFVSGEVVEGTTLWYEGDDYLGMGDTLNYCTTESTTLTGWFAQLPPDEFCTPFDVGVSSTGSPFTNNQIDWAILSENGATLLEGGAPYTDEVCLPNGCYTLEMFDSASNGWGNASLTITNPDGAVIGTYTLESGDNDSASFCVEDYDGPEPTVDDYIQVVSDELNITAVSDADAGFDWPTPVCTGGDSIVLIPNESSGEWTVDCDGCFDEATLTIDPAVAGSGWLAISHVLAGTCIDDYAESEMFITATPSPQLTASTEALCNDDFFDFNATPPFGTWSASCGVCIIPNTGVFFADQADEGLNTVTFTTLGVCPGDTSVEVGVSEEQAGVITGPELLCEDETVVFAANFPGFWSSDCFGCMDSLTGTFNPSGQEPSTWNISFMPDSYCPVGDEFQVEVNESVAIGASNVPNSLCETAEDFQLAVDVAGGTWSAPCPDCLSESGLLNVAGAPIGLLPIEYGVANGACADTATWTVDIRPVLEATFSAIDPLCIGSTANLTFTFDADIPNAYTANATGDWSSSDCPGCITNENTGAFAANQVGVVNVEFEFDHPCSAPFTGEVTVAPAVDATIDAVPDLCESGDLQPLSAAESGGVWSSDCEDCLVGASFDPTVGAGTYTVTYTIDDVCVDTDEVDVVVVPQADASVNLPDWVCLALEGLQPGVAWPGGVWTANCDGCLSDIGTIDLMQAGVGVLEITYTVEGLCGDSQSVAMEVVGCDVEVVNVFSPNGDEQNDELVFQYLTSFPGNQLTVFDRWGSLVYQKSNYGNNWRAEGVAEGTYYYVLTIPGKEDLTGTITLVR
jgi:gliding motility-associated-like protein